MSALRDHLERLASRPDVAAAILVSEEGLPVAHAGGPADWDELAALGASVYLRARALGPATGRGALRQSVAEFEGGLVAVLPVGPEMGLVVLATPGINAGYLLFDLERQRDALATHL